MTIHKIGKVADAEVDYADYFAASARDRDEMFAELQSWIATVVNPHLRALLEAIFADPEIAIAYRTAPAAKSVHHAWLGGLIEHVLSLLHLAKMTAAHYKDIDYDLLVAGVILHDIGKTRELSYARGFQYTTEGQLLGHIVIGMGMVQEKLARIPEFPRRLRDLLLHMIASHHGEMEYGSPKVPMFAEALLLHHLDNLDSKMECARNLVDRDRLVEGHWTGYSSALDRALLKKARYMEAEPIKAAEPIRTAAPQKNPTAQSTPPSSASPFGAKLQEALGRER